MTLRDGRLLDEDDDSVDDRSRLLPAGAGAGALGVSPPSKGAPRGYGAILVAGQNSGSTTAGRPTSPEEEGVPAEEGLESSGKLDSCTKSADGNAADGTSTSSIADEAVVFDGSDDDDDEIDIGDHRRGPSISTMSSRSTRHLAIAYAGLLLLAFTTSLEGQVTAPLAAFAVSSFNNHSLLSTVFVVQGVVNAVIKPPMAKMADVFGRLEAFAAAVLLCVTGYVQMASSHSIRTFSAAQILYSAGITGLQVLQQILVADTSDLRHRALLSSLPDTPFMVTVWIGPSIAAAVLEKSSWRWGYAMWAIILPLAFCPLAASLALNAYHTHQSRRQSRSGRGCLGLTAVRSTRTRTRTATRTENGTRPASSASSPSSTSISTSTSTSKASAAIRRLLTDLDAAGILLLSAALSLILLPLTLSRSLSGGWANPSLGLSVIVGLLLLVFAFPAWEARPHLAPHPLIPLALLRNITFCAGCGVGLFFFAVFYLSVQPYFYSYLLVVHNQDVATAGRITQIFSFTSTICAVTASIAIRHVRRYKPFVVAGAIVYLVGVACMQRYRTIDAGTVRLVATQIAVGSGAGLMSVPTQIGIQASVAHTPHLISAATAVYLTMGEVGIAVGSAISGAIWGHLVPAKLEQYLPPADRHNASAIYSSVSVAMSYPWGSPAREAIIRTYQESMTTLLFVAVGFCVPVLILALLMRDYRLDGNDSTNEVEAEQRLGNDADRNSDPGADAVEVEPLIHMAVGTNTADRFTGSASADERANLLSENREIEDTDEDVDGDTGHHNNG